MKKCPFCAEEIQDEAIKCKHCGEFLEKVAAPASPPPIVGPDTPPVRTPPHVWALIGLLLFCCVFGATYVLNNRHPSTASARPKALVEGDWAKVTEDCFAPTSASASQELYAAVRSNNKDQLRNLVESGDVLILKKDQDCVIERMEVGANWIRLVGGPEAGKSCQLGSNFIGPR